MLSANQHDEIFVCILFHTELLPQMWHEIASRQVIVSFFFTLFASRAKKRKRSLTCLQFHVTFGAIIRRGILTQIFPTGAETFRHCYQIWRESQQLSERSLGAKYQFLDFPHFYGGGQFLRRKLISTEEAYFYGVVQFLRSRAISTEEADFYGGGLFLPEQSNFYGGGQFLRRKLISTEEAYFYEGG